MRRSILSKTDGYVVLQSEQAVDTSFKQFELDDLELSRNKMREIKRYYNKVTAVEEIVLAKRHVLFAVPIYKGFLSKICLSHYYKHLVKYKIDEKIHNAIIYGKDGKTMINSSCINL